MTMRVLVLGGTSFVGRAIVEQALDAGAEVTLFGRGRTGPGLFPGVPRLTGDRDSGDLAALREGAWDAVADVSGYLPRQVGQAMDVLGDRVGRYLFISSHAVYRREGVAPGCDEDTPRRPAVRDTEELTEETYGPLKVACEDDVTARYGSRATIVRPGKVAGPHDPGGSVVYWVRRAARGGRIAVPGDPGQPLQLVDSRDLARLVVRLLADGRPGPTTLGGFIRTCAHVAGVEAEPVRVPAGPGTEFFPLIRTNHATQQRDPSRARAAGLTATPLATTAADILAWDRARAEPPLRAGFTPEQEQAALHAATAR
jgi:2'-hydroxyisoflavone reductase